MKQAISGYWKILKTEGHNRALWSFYSYYYTKYKLKKIKKSNNDLLVKTHGNIIQVNPNDEGLSTELLVFGSHEPDTTEFVSKYLSENMICLDIGANIGYYSTLYSRIVGNEGKVISVEPSPLNFKYLKKNLQSQNQKNFVLFNCACGNSEGKVNFQLDLRANKCKVLDNEIKIDSQSDIIQVPVRRIDDIIKESGINKLDFMKIDVEGYEWNTLQGGMSTIQKFKPTIQLEIHFTRIGYNITKQILEFLKNEGYEVIYDDLDSDEGSWFKKAKKSKRNIDHFFNLDTIKKHKNSFKLILENMVHKKPE